MSEIITRLCIGGPLNGQFLATCDDVAPFLENKAGGRVTYEKYRFIVLCPVGNVRAGEHLVFLNGPTPTCREILRLMVDAYA